MDGLHRKKPDKDLFSLFDLLSGLHGAYMYCMWQRASIWLMMLVSSWAQTTCAELRLQTQASIWSCVVSQWKTNAASSHQVFKTKQSLADNRHRPAENIHTWLHTFIFMCYCFSPRQKHASWLYVHRTLVVTEERYRLVCSKEVTDRLTGRQEWVNPVSMQTYSLVSTTSKTKAVTAEWLCSWSHWHSETEITSKEKLRCTVCCNTHHIWGTEKNMWRSALCHYIQVWVRTEGERVSETEIVSEKNVFVQLFVELQHAMSKLCTINLV